MVLILSVVKDEEWHRNDKTERYVLSAPDGRVAVFYDSNHQSPSSETVDAAIQDISLEEVSSHPFFVTSFDGLLDDTRRFLTPGGDADPDVLEVLMTEVGSCVAARENVTIINRGTRASEYVERILRTLQKSIEESAEHAMQIVADEIAKERQMQRLLQLENESNMHAVREYVKTLKVEKTEEESIKLSATLSRKLRKFRKKHELLFSLGKGSAERFTLLTATHRGELIPPCTRGSFLTSKCFQNAIPLGYLPPPSASRNTKNSLARNSHFNARLKRRSTISILELFSKEEGGVSVEPLKGNGWGKEMHCYVFDGETSIIGIPGVPKFEDLVKCFTVDFWFRKDACEPAPKRVLLHIMDGQNTSLSQLFQISLKNSENISEGISVFVRDGSNRVLECMVPLDAESSPSEGWASFHHFMLNVQSLEEGNLECFFDGRPIAMQVVQQEYPIFFNPWPHRLFIGGHMDESNMPVCVFKGVIREVRFGTYGDGGYKPIVRWPLSVEPENLIEATRTIPVEHHETLLNLERSVCASPPCAPSFDGDLVVNMGTLGILGELMYNWRLEIRFRTNVSNRSMSLIGVTDRQCRMQEFGIVLNAEPVFGKERFRFHEFNVTLYLVDAFGACCSALLRGSEHQNLLDGQWHTLVWKCIDSEANTYRVKVDGTSHELFYLVREGPIRFIPFVDWVCLGGHNVRNYKIQRQFYGEIGRCYLTVRGFPLTTLNMDEGPGAYVLQDASGNCNHGLLISSVTNTVRRNDVFWYPHLNESACEGPNTSNPDEIIIHKNNVVSLAAIMFTCEFSASGVASEVAYDIFEGTAVQLDVVEMQPSRRRPQWGMWWTLPKSCFRPVDTLVQLEETFNTALSAEKPLGHFMFVIRIGDCHVTLLNLHGPVLPPEAMYNRSMLKWQYAYSISGTKGWRELYLNQMVRGVENILLIDTMKPFATARLGPVNISEKKSIVTEDIIKSFQHNGRPWMLCAVLHNYLLNAEFGSHVHVIHHFREYLTADEAASIAVFNQRLMYKTKEKASILIQRNWRAWQSRQMVMQLQNEKQIRECKVEEIAALRLNPVVQAKTKLFALLITLHQIDCRAIPPIHEDVDELSEMLSRQGYKVVHLPNPRRAAFMKELLEMDENASSFVYISGYGGMMGVRPPTLFSLYSLHISISEGAQRAGIEEECGLAFREIQHGFRCEFPVAKARKSKRKNNAPPSKKMLQEAEMAARQREEIFRMSVAETEEEEKALRSAFEEECDTEVLMIVREMMLAIESIEEYERVYKQSPHGMQFILPCENRLIEPYANTLYNVEELLDIVFQRHLPPLGLQRIVAFDLEPVTPMRCGFACVASSTGHLLRFPYQPQQRRILSGVMKKAFDGRVPRVSAHSKYAVLHGGIETEPTHRDWKSFASYLVSKMQSVCSEEACIKLREELYRDVPFTAELIPVRGIVLNSEGRERLRREREAKEVNAIMRYGVGSSYVQSDMFGFFKNIVLVGVPIKEISFKNTICIPLTHNNNNIDGLITEALTEEVEKCRPEVCDVAVNITITAGGVQIAFDSRGSSDKLGITQWVNSIVVRSLTWRLPTGLLFGYRTLEVDHVKYLYDVKTTCSLRKFRMLKKQQHKVPIPIPYVHFLQCEIVS